MSSLMTIQNAGRNVFRVLDTNITSVLSTIESTSNTSGSLLIAGGAGISKNLYVGGNIVVSGSLSTASGAFDGVQTYTATQSSVNSTTGALAVINGGIGIGTTADAISETSGGGLTVRGGGAFGAKVFIGGDAGLRSNLTVTGTTTIVGTTNLLAPLNVTGTLVATGSTTILGTANLLAPLNVTGTLTTSGMATLVSTANMLSAVNVSGALIGSSDATIVGRIFGNSATDSTHATSDASVVVAGGVSIAKAASIGTQLRIGTVSTQAGTQSVIVGYGSAGGNIGFERTDRTVGPSIGTDATQQLNLLNIASNNMRSQFRFINSGTSGHLSRDSGLLLNNFTETTVGGMSLRLCTLGRLTTNTNYEFLNIANDSTGSWVLSSAAAGTGFLRPIGLQIQNNTGQLLLETSGNVSFANAVNVTGSLRNTGGMLVAGSGVLEFGSNVAGKEPNSGKIGYALFTADAVDFVGGGPIGQNRVVKIFDQLTVSNDIVVGTTKITPNPGDLAPASFTLANNQSSAANVTGLAFATATVRSFVAQVSVAINATTSLFTVYTLTGVQRGSDWVMSSSYTGDINTLAFTITSAGQIQYTTPNYTGFSSGTLKFRATTLPV